jgi:hypothetical protein
MKENIGTHSMQIIATGFAIYYLVNLSHIYFDNS